jgi:FMN phosphatase YigB (HAD superfamily)
MSEWCNFACVMKYKHIFFDLDHTLWDFETNS